MKSFENILVVAPSWIGDLVMATCAFKALRKQYPQAKITFLLKPGRARVLAGADFVDEVITLAPSNNPFKIFLSAQELRRKKFDLAIMFPDAFRTRLLIYLAGIPHRLGYSRNFKGAFLNHRASYPGEKGAKTAEPMPLRYQRLLEVIQCEMEDFRPSLAVADHELTALHERLQQLGVEEGEGLIGFNPGASFGASKIWLPEYFAQLGDQLYEKYGLRTILLVGPGEEDIARAIARDMKSGVISTADNRVPLDELKPLIRDLKLLITTDTGPRHYATAFRVPQVVLMGPTDRRYTDMNLDESIVLQEDQYECVPCHLKTCPIDHRCMVDLTPDKVLAAVEILDQKLGLFTK